MIETTVFTCASPSVAIGREAVIHANAGTALSMLAGSGGFTVRPVDDAACGYCPPGLMQVKSADAVIAFGRGAHTALADFRKRTLIASAVGDDDDDDLDRLIWSCLNTSKIVALGGRAWRSAQLLPIGDRRCYDVPPLNMKPGHDGLSRDVVLVIDHTEDSAGRDLAAFLQTPCLHVEYVGATSEPVAFRDAWSSKALVHIHVGRHSIQDERIRLIDTWNSQRLAIQLAPTPNHPDDLLIENEVNGFKCGSPDEILSCYEDVLSDPVLQKKVIDGGLRSVAPLVRRWRTIVEDLLS